MNTVVFMVSICFALRAGKEHRALRGMGFNPQFRFMKDSDGEVFLYYSEDKQGWSKAKETTSKLIFMPWMMLNAVPFVSF